MKGTLNSCFCFYNFSETLNTEQEELSGWWLSRGKYGRGRERNEETVNAYQAPGDAHVPNNNPTR
jgi:hypothetical protein